MNVNACELHHHLPLPPPPLPLLPQSSRGTTSARPPRVASRQPKRDPCYVFNIVVIECVQQRQASCAEYYCTIMDGPCPRRPSERPDGIEEKNAHPPLGHPLEYMSRLIAMPGSRARHLAPAPRMVVELGATMIMLVRRIFEVLPTSSLGVATLTLPATLSELRQALAAGGVASLPRIAPSLYGRRLAPRDRLIRPRPTSDARLVIPSSGGGTSL
ncbi:hypothetical protein BV20DRAFT_377150 [Pilatotrama ljubarskyi]|nr:hypothetical protein BV20DRAFT_377150 [Pilatotrama ljubarskyi]